MMHEKGRLLGSLRKGRMAEDEVVAVLFLRRRNGARGER